ncbi:MAG: pseudouridine synthase [Chthoniobacteraceae bacterium]
MLIAFNKPYGVLSQFTDEGAGWRTLKEFGFPRGMYPIGRLDAETEGLLLLSDEGALSDELLNPRRGHPRCYWAQVENVPSAEALAALEKGVKISDYTTRPCKAKRLDPQPEVPPRDPPIRLRKDIPDCWISMELIEGKNRQVRRMTAAIGHPTLRLLRVRTGHFELGALAPGAWIELEIDARKLVFAGGKPAPKPRIARDTRPRKTPRR